jgi:hypothetical protein
MTTNVKSRLNPNVISIVYFKTRNKHNKDHLIAQQWLPRNKNNKDHLIAQQWLPRKQK